MNKFLFAVDAVRIIRKIQKMRRAGMEYKVIDEVLELEGPDGDSFSYHIMREVRRGKTKKQKQLN